jgi:DNA-binding NtrC family response regulator
MERYMWFGNLAELEAVMLRSMAMAQDSTLDADDLLFDATRLASMPAPAARRSPAQPESAELRPDAPPPQRRRDPFRQRPSTWSSRNWRTSSATRWSRSRR